MPAPAHPFPTPPAIPLDRETGPPRRLPCRAARHARGRRGPRHQRRHRELGQRRRSCSARSSDRIKALADLAHTPLFFGRLDYLHAPARTRPRARRASASTSAAATSTTPTATRWSSTGARPSPSRSTGPPRRTRMDVGLRRRFGYTGGELTAYEDEHLTDPAEAAADQQAAPAGDRAAARRPDAGHRRDDPAGAGRDRTGRARRLRVRPGRRPAPARPRSACTGSRICSTPTASGSPAPAPWSSGRTAPSSTTSSRCCPRSGELEVKQATVDDLVAPCRRCAARTTGGRPRSSRATRGWRRCCGGPCAPHVHAAAPSRCVVVRGSRRWRVPAYELEEIVAGVAGPRHPLRRGPRGPAAAHRARGAGADGAGGRGARRPGAGRGGPQPRGEGGGQGGLAAGRPGEAGAAAAVRRRTSSPRTRRGSSPRTSRRRSCGRSRARSVKSAQVVGGGRGADRRGAPTWCSARTRSGHVVLDEAQDLSPMQYRAVGRRCTTGSATVLGDLAQGTTPWATASWEEALAHLGKPGAVVEELTAGFRVPREVIAYASRLLPAHRAGPARGRRRSARSPGDFAVRAVRAGGAGRGGRRRVPRGAAATRARSA